MNATQNIGTAAKSLIKGAVRRSLLAGKFRSKSYIFAAKSGDEMPVLMCLWNRPGRVVEILRQLDRQDFTGGIELYLWNNNRRDHGKYLDLIQSFTPSGSLREISIVKSPFNLGSIGRFYWARKLQGLGRTGPVVVIDDDEDLTDDFIAVCAKMYTPKCVFGFWAWVVGASYWDREPAVIGGKVDHVGPGGMVCDLGLFSDSAFFLELPQKYWFLDDVWFTYFAKKKGLTLGKLPVDIEFVLPETNQHHSLGPLKDEFFHFLYSK